MNNQRMRIVSLLLGVLLVFSVALWSDHAVLTIKDDTKTPALVVIHTPEETYEQLTFAPTLIEAIDEAGVALGENDSLSEAEDTPLKAGSTLDVTVNRRDAVKLNWSGYELDTSSEISLSMGELISRSGYDSLDSNVSGRVEQNKNNSESAANAELSYVQVFRKMVRDYEQIPFSTVTLDDPNQTVGHSKVKTEGKTGKRVILIEETYENGLLVNSEIKKVEVLREPVQQVILEGTRPVIPRVSPKPPKSKVEASFNKIKGLLNKNGNANYRSFSDNGNGTITVDGKTFSFIEQKKRTITMYDGLECCLQDGCHSPAINHNTASGIKAQRGLVAAYGYRSNGKFVGTALPLGTILFIEGYGLAVVADVHGAHWNHELLDACYDAGEINNGSVTWGKRTKRVYIIELP